MARENYDYLHDATKATFAPNVKAIADGWGKTERQIYYILSEERPDFFPAFLSQYIGVLKGGVSTCFYDNELKFARFRYGKKKSAHDATTCFTEKLRTHNTTMTEFIELSADGTLDLEDIKKLESCLNDEQNNLDMIRTMLNFKKDLLENVNGNGLPQRAARVNK